MTTPAPVLADRELAGVARVMREAGAEPAGPLSARLIAGGRSNLTVRLDDGERSWVLRTPPRTGRTPSAHDVAREFRVTSALGGTEVPVARAVVLCEDDAVLGGPFAVADFVEGRTVQSAADLALVPEGSLAPLLAEVVRVLAALHRVDHVAVGLERFGRPDAYAERQLRRWSGQWELVGDRALDPLAAELAGRLGAALPRQASTGVVHGDYRIDNVLVDLHDPDAPRVRAVVDWELSTIGDPVADVAMALAYQHPAFDLVVGEPSAWTSAALGGPDALLAAYESAGGAPLVDLEAHLALAHYKLAVIAAGIDHRRRAGSGSGAGFDTAGAAVEPSLRAGLAALG